MQTRRRAIATAATAAAVTVALSGCATFSSLIDSKPDIAKPAESVLAFAKCADVAGPPLLEHLAKERVLTAQEKAQLAIEVMRCALVTADELYVEKARQSTESPAPASVMVVTAPVEVTHAPEPDGE